MNSFYNRYGKRFFDCLLAIIFLVGLSWLFLLIAALYLVATEFPIIFKQHRTGRYDKAFVMYKFRTMKNIDAPIDQRRFWLGDILRATNLDELPQLWNVLKGEMAIVGPRPLPEEYAPLLSQVHKARHLVRPGITGLAQTSGKNSISWKEKFEYDLRYVKSVTFSSDIRILLKTIILVGSMKPDVSLREEKFKG